MFLSNSAALVLTARASIAARFASIPETAATAIPPVAPSRASATLSVISDPSGADIEIDGNFVGNTPSDVQVAEGDHTITVKKMGFTNWERKLRVSGGSSVHLSAELEKVPNP